MRWEKNLCALEVLILCAILIGALIIQYGAHDLPCALCLLQRAAMIGVGVCLLLNIRFTPRRLHYGFAMLFALFGGFTALRQIALHVCPQFPLFGLPFWGISLYMWSFLIFASTITYNALLLMLFDRPTAIDQGTPRLGLLAIWLLTLVSLANIFASFDICHFGISCG